MARGRKGRRKARRIKRSGRARAGRKANKIPWALVGAGTLLAASGAYLLWPRTVAAVTLPPAPLASPGSSSPSSRAASGSTRTPSVQLPPDSSNISFDEGDATGVMAGSGLSAASTAY